MSILVNTPAGRTGRRVTRTLVAAGRPVTVIARHPEKLGDLAGRVTVVAGSIDDPDVLDRAMKGVHTVYWVSPASESADLKGVNQRRARLAVETAGLHGVRRAVVLSSVSAQVASGTGLIAALNPVEQEFRRAFEDVAILRAGLFMENHLGSVAGIAGSGEIHALVPGDVAFPQVATRDVADRAAELLRDRAWTGQRVVGLHGPADLSYDQVAATLSTALGRPVRFVRVPPDQARRNLTSSGVPAHVADGVVEMYVSLANGAFQRAEPRTRETTTPTTFAQFTLDTLKPAIESAAREGAHA